MSKIVLIVHGGAGSMTPYLKKHQHESDSAIKMALLSGFALYKKGKSALDIVEAAAIVLEDNPLFNAGKGSALNKRGEVEMDAAIMDGKTLAAGAVSIVRQVKNPIFLARKVMHKTKHVLLSGYGALELARLHQIEIKPESYFITDYQLALYEKCRKRDFKKISRMQKIHGTIGAVARDKNNNLAAATSTGGTSYSLPGRIGDSCIIGAGCYANNKTCAVSGTGEGEFLMTNVIAHTISQLIEYKGYSLQKACETAISKTRKGDMGVIAVNQQGKVGIFFNTKMMRRGLIDVSGKITIET